MGMSINKVYACILFLLLSLIFFVFINKLSLNPTILKEPDLLDEYQSNVEVCSSDGLILRVKGWVHVKGMDDASSVKVIVKDKNGYLHELKTQRVRRKDVSDYLKINSKWHLHGFYAEVILPSEIEPYVYLNIAGRNGNASAQYNCEVQ